MANNVCCSIEMEPRTLNEGQLNYAREMAADAAQKMERREACAIIIEGLGLISAVETEEVHELTDEKHIEYCKEKAQNIVEKPCQCSCNSINMESPDPNNIIISNVKEPVTAPF